MSSPSKEHEEPSSSCEAMEAEPSSSAEASDARPPAKRRISSTVIEISDTESDDSDVCAVNSYQASADEVKRIRGDAETSSSSSSSSDYSSDSESSWEDDSVVVDDDKMCGKAVRTQLNPRAPRMEDPKLNAQFQSEELIEKLRAHWKEQKDFSSPEVTLTSEPFRLCLLHDLLTNEDFINNIVDDMNTLDWSRKKMDLYEFHQTADLASLTWQRSIRGIYELLKTEVMPWVCSVTGLELVSVSASCSLYGPGDHLLVHDDLLGDRRVAFILYLAPWRPPAPAEAAPALENGAAGDHVTQYQGAARGWAAHMGGALELLGRDARGRPARVRHRVYPANNMLAFFKVGVDSFHQVGEVVSLELPRLSINGWFHGPEPAGEPRPEPPEAPPPPAPIEPHNEVVLLNQWVEATYMSPRSRLQIQAQMEQASEVCLRSFFQEQKYRELVDALRDPAVQWEAAGPGDARRHWRLAEAWRAGPGAQHPAAALLHLVSSAAFVRLLADCTDLAITGLSFLELQRWGPGDFTLLPPRSEYSGARLAGVAYLGVPARALSGGGTCFVAPEEAGAEALVWVPPAPNALSLVYCDAGAAAFTKYVSHITLRPGEYFYLLACTYVE